MTRLLMAVALVAGIGGLTALAQGPGGGRGGFGFGGGPTTLLRTKIVKEDLKVTDEQDTKIQAWAKEFATKTRETMTEKLKDVPMDERFQKMAEITAENNKTAYTELSSILKPEQITRLKQIGVQVAGARAFRDPEVVAALKLTDDQKDKVKDTLAASAKESQELRTEYGLGGGRQGGGKGKGKAAVDADKMKEYQKKNELITKETLTKVAATLTDDQKKTWQTLSGETFDVAKLQTEMAAQGGFGGGGRKKKEEN
ncbi:hypothetical protein FRUB_07072 [Fimbriiglobus ruber]|uniref:Uncharacterized protein n=1 Tax=Fimbriiglobus ruber TaxID=1908690 RepID=A0A225D914_9BACT|nr:hypothetical protein FRUB_07072 [Fimbriiglobus ruber]